MAFWRQSGPPKATAAKTLKHFSSTSDQPSAFHVLALRANQNKHLIKGLIAYYGELQSSYVSQAEHHGSKLIETLPLPFHETFFLPATDHQGYQGALTQIRDRSRALSAALAEMGQSIETQVISVLQSARSDIKALLKQMDEELGMLTETVDKSRADAAQALRDHDAGLALYESPSHSSFSANNAHQDPFLTHGITSLHLNNQVDLENKQLRITLQYQSLWRDLEMKINTAIVQASQSFLEIQLMGDVKLKAEFAGIEEAISNVSAQAEWDLFAQPPRIVNDQTQPRNESVAALFPAQDHAASQPLFSGPLDRQRSLTRSFATFYFVLTPSGFLHEFDAGGLFDVTDVDKLNPHLSIFLSDFTLSQPSNFDDPKGQRFSLTGPRGSASGKDAQQGLGGSFGLGKSSLVTYVFKANERDQLLDWWDACKRYCKLSPVEEGIKSPSSSLGPGAVPISPQPDTEHQLPPTPPAEAEQPAGVPAATPSTMADRDDEIDRRSSYFNTNTSNADRASTTATSVQEENEPVSPKSSAAAPTVSSAGLREDDGLQLKELEHDDDASIHVADKIQNLKVDNGDSSTDDGDLESGKTKVQDASVSDKSPRPASYSEEQDLPETPTSSSTRQVAQAS